MIPERIRWAVDQLALRGQERVLEIGCGGGVAVELIAKRLSRGKVLAFDRSAKMVERAQARNREGLSSGRVELREAALETVDLPKRSFDKIFAVNVNHFWVRDPAPELARLKQALKTRGELLLFYEPPARASAVSVGKRVQRVLETNGFQASTIVHRSSKGAALLCVRGSRE